MLGMVNGNLETMENVTVKQLKNIISWLHPVWINYDGDCEYYPHADEIDEEYNDKNVTYITLDRTNTLTLEIE